MLADCDKENPAMNVKNFKRKNFSVGCKEDKFHTRSNLKVCN